MGLVEVGQSFDDDTRCFVASVWFSDQRGVGTRLCPGASRAIIAIAARNGEVFVLLGDLPIDMKQPTCKSSCVLATHCSIDLLWFDVADTRKLALKSSIVVKASWAIELMAIVLALSCRSMY